MVINPIATPYHLVKIRINITSVNASENSIPWKEKNPARLPSTTPIPIGKNDTTPIMMEVVYVADNSKNSRSNISNEYNTRNAIRDSISQKIIDSDEDIKKIFPLIDFLSVE